MLITTFDIFTALFLVAANPPQQISVSDILVRQCEEGNQHACDRLEQFSEDLDQQKRLLSYSEKFKKEFNGDDFTVENKPDLYSAYPVALNDFFMNEQAAGFVKSLDENILPDCAQHYHNHWINRKIWWPSDKDGSPDWGSIYIYIVDHYYGYCLKRLAVSTGHQAH